MLMELCALGPTRVSNPSWLTITTRRRYTWSPAYSYISEGGTWYAMLVAVGIATLLGRRSSVSERRSRRKGNQKEREVKKSIEETIHAKFGRE